VDLAIKQSELSYAIAAKVCTTFHFYFVLFIAPTLFSSLHSDHLCRQQDGSGRVPAARLGFLH